MNNKTNNLLFGFTALWLMCMAIGCNSAQTPSSKSALLSVALQQVDNGSVVNIVLQNTSPQKVYLGWDRYSNSRLLGQLHFAVQTNKGNVVPLTPYGLRVYQSPVLPIPLHAVSRSWTSTVLMPKQQQIMSINLSEIFQIKPSGIYTVSASYVPGQSDKSTPANANAIVIKVDAISKGPALYAQFSDRGMVTTYSEGN